MQIKPQFAIYNMLFYSIIPNQSCMLLKYYSYKFITVMKHHERTNKNQSMVSTHHMSCNQSYATNFYDNHRPNTAALPSYAHISLPKQCPKWNQSSATLRHTPRRFSFSKDSRFKDNCSYYSDILKPQIPSTLNSKSCTFGKGIKKPISEVVLRNAKQKPAPDRYDMKIVDETPRSTSKGKTFGLGWKYYEKNFIKHRKDAYAEFHSQNNPPAKYEVRQIPGDNKHKYTAYSRLKMYSQKIADDVHWVPGPYHIVKDRHLYGTVGLNERSFGVGERLDLSRPANDNPEAIYEIKSFCDKFMKIRHKHEKRVSKSP